jgi:acetyltransferase-like isoleucine patch superfamily enzyme
MFKFGLRKLTIIDSIYDRTIWKLSGTLIIKGSVGIGRGTKINVDENATLIFGDNFDVTGNTTFVCNKEIQFGSNCLLSWDILIMDSDQHAVIDVNNNVLNPPKAISIGNHVWIGCRSTILKGVCIADDNIVAANSTVTKSFTNSNSIIGGHGKNVEVIKNNINWRH